MGLRRSARHAGVSPKWRGRSVLASTVPAVDNAPVANPPMLTPAEIFDLADFERAAQQRASPMAWEYLNGGAADEHTLRWNRESFGRIRLRPRALVDVSKLDTRLTLLGRELPFPILLAPVAYQRLYHPDGEAAAARGAGAADAVMVVSTSATTSLEDVAAAATKPLWFQLYVQPDRGFTQELVRRAEAAKYEALVVTVDTPVLGPRYREIRSHFTLPAGMERPNFRTMAGGSRLQTKRPTEKEIYSATLDPTLTWKDIEWLQSLTRLPLLLKGIMNPDDAERAARMGVAGLIVSNHGARNLDTLPATIDVLPEIARQVDGRVPLLLDGGIRRGTDVLKALALGARAVLIGRPYVCGLAVQGPEGVTRVVNILRREFEMAMALAGRASLHEIDVAVIWR